MHRVPAALRSRVTVLKGRGNKQVFVLGTAHLSKRSEEDVGELVKAIKPSDIFVELCGARADILTRDVKHDFANFGPREFLKAWKQSGNIFAVGYAYALHSLGQELELTPGAEFRAAYLAGQEHSANILMGDRNVETTIFRVWHGLRASEKLELFWQVVVQGDDFMRGGPDASNDDLKKHIDNLAESVDLRLIFEEMDKSFPWIVESLLRERDVVMSIHLKQMLRPPDEFKSKNWPEKEASGDIVAVVGAAHVDGIIKEWLTDRSPREEYELLRTLNSSVVKPTAKGKMSAYDGVPGFTKADLKHYVANYHRERAAKCCRLQQKEDEALFRKHKGILFESEKQMRFQ